MPRLVEILEFVDWALLAVSLLLMGALLLSWRLRRLLSARTRSLRQELVERRRVEQELRVQRDRARLYFELVGVILVVIGPDAKVRMINRKGCEILGRPADQTVGRNWFELALPARMVEQVQAVFRQLMAGQVEPAQFFENPIVTADGRERTILWHNTVLRDEAGRIVSTLSAGEDITERKGAEDALRTASELKSRFILVASHELFTPISYMLGTARLLKDSADPSRLARAVRMMGQRAERLNEILQAMFKLMPEELAASQMHYADATPGELIEEVRAHCEPFAQERGQRLVVQVEPGLPSIRVDRGKLHDALENLVVNAIQFGPDGSRIAVGTVRHWPEAVAFSVHDEGGGIPDGELPHIFEPFYSGGDVMRHSTGWAGRGRRGMGLGLAIARHFVVMHGGSVQVRAEGGGTTFTMVLPIQPPPSDPSPAPDGGQPS